MTKRPNRSKISLAAACLHIEALRNRSSSLMNFRLVPEMERAKAAFKRAARKPRLRLSGTIRELFDTLAKRNRQGFAVYYVLNLTDGMGTKRENIKKVVALPLDLDGAPLPKKYHGGLIPHVVVETSPGKFQLIFLIKPTNNFDAAKSMAQRLAKAYGGDPSVCDAARVLRLAGFKHQKGEPFVSRIIERNEFEPPYKLKQFDAVLPPMSTADTLLRARSGAGSLGLKEIKTLLNDQDPAVICPDNITWETLAMSVHAATGGDEEVKQFMLDWFARDPNYGDQASYENNEQRWNSFDAAKQGGRGTGTLRHVLKEHVNEATLHSVFNDAAKDFDASGDALGDECDDDHSWLEGKKEKPKAKFYDETKLPTLLDFAERCLIDQGAPIYQMGGRLVHPVRADRDSGSEETIRRQAGSLTIGDVKQHRLREYFIENAPFYKIKWGMPVAFPASMGLAAHYLSRGDKWRVPIINGIIETPTLRRDGSILDCDGYDAQSGLLLDKGGVQFPDIPEQPTKADALKALAKLKDPFAGFPFVSNRMGRSASRSVMLSAVLTALVRRTLHSAPMHGTSAPTMGTGKTLAIDVVSLIATGRLTTAMSQGANEEEDEKRLFSVLLQNDLILLIDNVKRPIEGDALCTVLTQSTWQSRVLGESRKVEVPTNALIMASGNNLTYKGDMTTRALLCRLDAKMENPETRRFEVDLKTWVPQHRTELVVAGLTVLRAFVVAGRPGLDNLTPFGRFEDWSNLVRGALVWLGEPDPCKTRAFIAVDDPERSDLSQLLDAIRDNAGDDAFTAAELIKIGEDCSDSVLTEAIEATLPGRLNAKTLGHYLRGRNGKIINGARLVGAYDSHAKVWKYRVRPV